MIGVGDAVVDTAHTNCPHCQLKDSEGPVGAVYRVLWIGQIPPGRCTCCRLGGLPGLWCIGTLRKVQPADAGFRALLATVRPKVRA